MACVARCLSICFCKTTQTESDNSSSSGGSVFSRGTPSPVLSNGAAKAAAVPVPNPLSAPAPQSSIFSAWDPTHNTQARFPSPLAEAAGPPPPLGPLRILVLQANHERATRTG